MAKLFRKSDQDLVPGEGGAAVRGLVNTSFSAHMGAGIGVFENCAMEWTVTYDEVLFILDGRFRLQTREGTYEAGPGDTLWIPAGSWVVYEADAPVTFFYAVCPISESPTTSAAHSYPEGKASN